MLFFIYSKYLKVYMCAILFMVTFLIKDYVSVCLLNFKGESLHIPEDPVLIMQHNLQIIYI